LDSPEAEWGFDPALNAELSRLCRAMDRPLERLSFATAQALSGPVAELYRAWYREHGHPADRLLVGSFALIDAHLPITRGLVPYWTVFPTLPARDALGRYLTGIAPYAEIHLGLFSHGTCSIGHAGPADWDEILTHATRRGSYCGVDRAAHPQDFAGNARYHRQAARLPPAGAPPGPAPWPWVRHRLRELADPAVGYDTEPVPASDG
jgi:hypothetical protein